MRDYEPMTPRSVVGCLLALWAATVIAALLVGVVLGVIISTL